MAHFARVNSENIVTYVTPIDNELITINDIEIPEIGVAHLYQTIPDSIEDKWIQTSYNHKFRNCFAAIGYSYNPELDIFIQKKPYPSWIFDTNSLTWEAPIKKPSDNKFYDWDENNMNWVLIE